VAKGFSQIQGHKYDEMVVPVVDFDSLSLLSSIEPANGFVPQQLNVKAAILYAELKETIYIDLPEGYRDGNDVPHLKKLIYGFKPSPREWNTCFTTYLRRHRFDTSNFDPYVP
jgi:hypothetical protein